MARRCMRQCMSEDGMMGQGWRKHGMMGRGGMMGPFATRMIFALIDRHGDGTISLEEFQAAHERIFNLTKMTPSLRRRCWTLCVVRPNRSPSIRLSSWLSQPIGPLG
jgi:hypothetical protein